MITEAEERGRDRDAATSAYTIALAMAELEYASLEAAVQRANILKAYIRVACRLLGRTVDDKYLSPQELGHAFTGSQGGRQHGQHGTHTGTKSQGQGMESANRGESRPK